MEFYKLSIKEINRETPHAVSIVFNIPEEYKSFYTFQAGQYVTLKLTLDGKEVRRAYSICSSVLENQLKIAVKAVNNGFFSKFANSSLNVGDLIEVSKPEGKFTFEPKAERQRNYLGFAAGSGITPIFSILKSVLEAEVNSTFVLVYGNKSIEETIFHNELKDFQQKYLGRLFVHYVFSQQSVSTEFSGRIEKSIVNEVFNKHTDKSFEKFYLCGPETMINTVSQVLKEKNFAEKDIKFELFNTDSTPENNVDSNLDHVKVTVIVDNEEHQFEMSSKQTVLEAALKHGLDVPYSCQGGICSSCICKVKDGKTEMRKNQILSDSEIEEGLSLACQAVPTSNTITIDFDDL